VKLELESTIDLVTEIENRFDACAVLGIKTLSDKGYATFRKMKGNKIMVAGMLSSGMFETNYQQSEDNEGVSGEDI
jgi:hypothetical protein